MNTEFKMDTPEKLEAYFMGYKEAIQIMKNYTMYNAVKILEDCLRSKEKVVGIGLQLAKEIKDFNSNKLQ